MLKLFIIQNTDLGTWKGLAKDGIYSLNAIRVLVSNGMHYSGMLK